MYVCIKQNTLNLFTSLMSISAQVLWELHEVSPNVSCEYVNEDENNIPNIVNNATVYIYLPEQATFMYIILLLCVCITILGSLIIVCVLLCVACHSGG